MGPQLGRFSELADIRAKTDNGWYGYGLIIVNLAVAFFSLNTT